MLSKAQEATDTKECKLVKSASTRFASLLASFRSCLDYRKAITHLYTNLVERSVKQRLPSELIREVVATVYLTVKPIMASLMVSQSSSSNCMLSTLLHKIIQLYVRLVKGEEDESDEYLSELKSSMDPTDFQKLEALHMKLRESVLESLRELLQPYASFERKASLYWLVLMTDPRFELLDDLKDLRDADSSFKINSLAVEYEEKVLCPALVKCYLVLNPTALNQAGGRRRKRAQTRNHGRDFPRHQQANRTEDKIQNTCKAEYPTFRDQDELEASRCPFLFYRTFSKRFPTLAYLAKTLFAVPSSRTTVERLFSVAGHVANAHRNRLKVETSDTAMGIKINLPDTVKYFGIEEYLYNEAELIEEYEHDLSSDSD